MLEEQVILNFHGIGVPHEGVDAAERPYWVSEDLFASIVQSVAGRSDRDRVTWTFDDGNKSDLNIGAPVLAKHGLKGAFFVLTGRFDDPHYLSKDDTRALVSMGMDVGLHGRDHVDWRAIDDATLDAETARSRADLGDVLGRSVESVAIPFGAYNRKVMSHLRRLGFTRIYTSDGGRARRSQRVQNRTSVRGDMTLKQVVTMIDTRPSTKQRLRRAASTTLRRYFR